MYTQNGWWFLSSGGSYPPVFTIGTLWGLVIARMEVRWILELEGPN